MLTLTPAQLAALQQRAVMRRIFIWCEVLDPVTGAPSPAGFWDDVGTVTIDGRTYYGSGRVIQVAPVAARGDLTIPTFNITLSGIDPNSAALVRGRAVAQRPITVSLGIYDVADHVLIPPLIPRFVGFVDKTPIVTPAAGGASTVTLVCASASRAMTVQRTETRSAAACEARTPGDKFYQYTNLQAGQTIYFGRPSVRPSKGSAFAGPGPIGGAFGR